MPSEEKSCQHCGAPFRGDSEFCCRGCEYVHQLILDEGLDRYYELKDRSLPPVGSTAFHQRDDRELVEKWKNAEEVAPGVLRMEFELKGISCVGCVWLIEKLYSRYSGTVSITIDPQQGRVTIEAERDFELAAFAAEIQRFGYTLRDWSGLKVEGAEGRSASGRIGVCAFLAMNAMAFTLPFYLGMDQNDPLAPLLQFAVMILSTFSVLVGGTFFFRRAIAALRVGTLHIDLPIAIGILVAYAGSFAGWLTRDPNLFYFDFITIFILLMLVGRWLQERVTEQNVRQGYEKSPAEQFVEILDGTFETAGKINVRDIKSGMVYRTSASAWIPVQSRLEMDFVDASLESINGESEPRTFGSGEVLPAGAIVLSRSGSPALTALEDWSQSLLKRLFEVNSGGNRESSLMERVLKVYILTVIALSVVGFSIWGWLLHDFKTGFQVAVSVLVVSCPCAIGLAYPKVNDQCARWLRNRGVYIRLHSMWGRIRRVKQLFFDKTGTLTLETLDLLNPDSLMALSIEQRQALFALVDRNLHPVGRSLKEHLLSLDTTLSRTSDSYPQVLEKIGYGVSVNWRNRNYELNKTRDINRAGESDFLEDGRLVCGFRFSDSIRNDVKACIEWFEKQSLQVTIISGDTAERVKKLTDALQLPQERGVGGLSPQAKAQWIETHAPESAMMIGDGANDALAFEKAGCRATPVIGRGILENHSDFFFLGQGIQGIVDVFRLERKRTQALREIMTLTISYNLVVVVISFLGWMNPLLAAVLMPISSIVTVSWASIRLASFRLNRAFVAETCR